MDKKNPTWESVRSKLTQDGFIYRMKLGNPTPSAGHPQSRPSPPQKAAQPPLPPTQRPLTTLDRQKEIDAEFSALTAFTSTGLLNKLSLAEPLPHEFGLDPSAAIGFCTCFTSLGVPELIISTVYQSYEPFVIQRCCKSVSFDPRNFLDAEMLEDKMLAQALVVWLSDMRQQVGQSEVGRQVLLSQRSEILVELRRRISSPDSCNSVAVVWTVLSLVATEVSAIWWNKRPFLTRLPADARRHASDEDTSWCFAAHRSSPSRCRLKL